MENGKFDKKVSEGVKKAGRIYNTMRSTFLEKIPKYVNTDIVNKVMRPILYG